MYKLQARLTERRGSKAVRLLESCSRTTVGGSSVSMPTIAIFVGSPNATKTHSLKMYKKKENHYKTSLNNINMSIGGE